MVNLIDFFSNFLWKILLRTVDVPNKEVIFEKIRRKSEQKPGFVPRMSAQEIKEKGTFLEQEKKIMTDTFRKLGVKNG